METCMWYMQNFDQSDWMFIRCDGELGPCDIPWDGLADWSQELLLQIQAVGGAGGGAWAGSPVVWEPCHNGKFEWLDSNRHMKSNVSLVDDGHLVVLYYPLFLNIPEGIFFCWFRPFSKFLQKNSFLWVRVRVRVIYMKSSASQDRLLSQNMVDCNMFLFKKLCSKLYWIYSCVSRNGGLTCGSMRALPPGLNTSVWTTASPSLTFGHSSWTLT